ncbi:MAG: SIMPL domain-containing protein, partial [Alphaproteobacteria bacterium]|nr:SIMPL domain-containing protein [Alphaproteobacteria bacterium]
MRISSLFTAVLIALTPVAAVADPAPHTITVSGQGEARGAPNQAMLSAGVVSVAPTAAAALAENARKMTGVFAALKKLGVPERSIQTSNFSVQPQYPPYNQNATGLQRIVGYQVSNQVDVVLDDTAKLGPALDALVGAGANQINSVSFGIKGADVLQAKARADAVVDARTRA